MNRYFISQSIFLSVSYPRVVYAFKSLFTFFRPYQLVVLDEKIVESSANRTNILYESSVIIANTQKSSDMFCCFWSWEFFNDLGFGGVWDNAVL